MLDLLRILRLSQELGGAQEGHHAGGKTAPASWPEGEGESASTVVDLNANPHSLVIFVTS
jgi:hypothetical protein